MGVISLTLPSDGQTIDASDVNTPFNTIATAVNGNLDITNLSTGSAWAWTSYTPTFANTTLGNGSAVGQYTQIGKTVFFRAAFTLNTTSAMGTTPTVTLPVAANANYAAGTEIVGALNLVDAGVTNYVGVVRCDSSTIATLLVEVASGTYVTLTGLTAAVPFAWGTSDYLTISGMYQAA